jgi:hypothetical protein
MCFEGVVTRCVLNSTEAKQIARKISKDIVTQIPQKHVKIAAARTRRNCESIETHGSPNQDRPPYPNEPRPTLTAALKRRSNPVGLPSVTLRGRFLL